MKDYIIVIFGTIGLLLTFITVAMEEKINERLQKTIVIVIIAIAIIIILNLLARDFNL